MTTIVNRRDIRLEEEQEDFPQSFMEGPRLSWIAALDGRLSTGEEVNLSRQGATSAEALGHLEAAIEDNGWSIR